MADPLLTLPSTYAMYEAFHSAGIVKAWSAPYVAAGGDPPAPPNGNAFISMGDMSNDGFEFNHKVSYSMREVQQLFYALGAFMTKQELDLKFTLKHLNPAVAYRYGMAIPGGQTVTTVAPVTGSAILGTITIVSATQLNNTLAWPAGVVAGSIIKIMQAATTSYVTVVSVPAPAPPTDLLNFTPALADASSPIMGGVFLMTEGSNTIPLGEPSDILASGADATQGLPISEPEYRQWLFQFAAPGFNFQSAGRKAAFAYVRLWKAAVTSHGALKHHKSGEVDMQMDVKAFADLSVTGPNHIGKIYIPTPVA